MQVYDYILSCNYSPWSPYRGGGQKSTHMIASELGERGFQVAVLYSKGLLESFEVPPDLPYDVIWVPFVGLKPNMSAPFRFLNPHNFLKVARRYCSPHTVVHSQGEEAAFFGQLNCKRWVHSNRFPDFPQHILKFPLKQSKPDWKLWIRDAKYANVQKCIQDADVITTTSSHNQARVQALFGRESTVVPNGIDSAFLEHPWPAAKDSQGIFYWGRMVGDKGVDTLIQAYLKLPQGLQERHPLLLAGQGDELEQYQALALGHPQIRFIPWIPSTEVIHHIQQSRLVCLPSRDESFGNTMLEALATGIPTITTLAGSIPEVLGPHGIKINAGDVEALSCALLEELNLAPQFQVDQVQYVQDNYSWSSTVDQFLRLYS